MLSLAVCLLNEIASKEREEAAVIMLSVNKHDVTSRNYEEEDGRENNIGVDTLSIKFLGNNSSLQMSSSTKLLFVSCESAIILGDSIVEDLGLERVADIVDSKGAIYSGVFTSPSCDLKVVRQQKEVAESLISQFTNLLTEIPPKFVITLGMFMESGYVSSSPADRSLHGTLKKLTTTAFSRSDQVHLVENIGLLDCGNVVTGLPASILNYCEVRSIPSVLAVSITTTALTVPTMKAFEGIIALCSHIADAAELKRPDTKKYNEFAKRDPFLMRTQTIYC